MPAMRLARLRGLCVIGAFLPPCCGMRARHGRRSRWLPAAVWLGFYGCLSGRSGGRVLGAGEMLQKGKTEKVLDKAAHAERLTDDEVQQVRDFLTTVKTLGRIGKFLLWAIITAGALAAAVSQVRAQWFNG